MVQSKVFDDVRKHQLSISSLSLTHPLTSFLFPPDKVLYTDLPLVLSAPTGSGKTVVFELAIVRLLQQTGQQISSVKIVYGEQCWSNIGITVPHCWCMQWLR